MKDWLLPTLGCLIVWGLWSFIPKLTTQYISPNSAILYEVMGAVFMAIISLAMTGLSIEMHPKGSVLAVLTGMLGALGAFFFLTAVSKGPVTLVSTVSALYPIISVGLAIAFLNETLSLRQTCGVGLAILSIILIAA